jgi:hypothetical protein
MLILTCTYGTKYCRPPMFIESIKTPKIWNTMASESPRLLE